MSQDMKGNNVTTHAWNQVCQETAYFTLLHMFTTHVPEILKNLSITVLSATAFKYFFSAK